MTENISMSHQEYEHQILNLKSEIQELRQQVNSLAVENKVAIVCFSGEWDKLFAAFTIANGALALGEEVHMFFTFWGATAIRNKTTSTKSKKTIPQKMLGWMLPDNIRGAPLSKMNFGGLGKVMMGKQMKEQGIDDLPTLMEQAREMGAHFHCCDTSLQLLGWDCEELLDREQSEWCGVSSFLSLALKSKVTLFI